MKREKTKRPGRRYLRSGMIVAACFIAGSMYLMRPEAVTVSSECPGKTEARSLYPEIKHPGQSQAHENTGRPDRLSGFNALHGSIKAPDTVEAYNQVSDFGPLPEFMAELSIDGEMKADNAGNLIISKKNKHLFDFFLSAASVEGRPVCEDRVREYIRLTLPTKAGAQALGLFESYLSYRKKLAEFQPYERPDHGNASRQDILASMQANLKTIRRIRRDNLGDAVADAFFGDEEAITRYTLTAMEMRASEDLTANEKEKRMVEARQELPEKIRKGMAEFEETAEFNKTITELKNNPENRARIFELREQRYGQEGAQRLAALDEKRAGLKKRYASFCDDIRSDPANSRLNPTELTRKTNRLVKDEFEEWELAALGIRQ